MSCQCPSTQNCACRLRLKVDGTFLVPYVGLVPLEPVDLSGVATGSETPTTLQLNSSIASLVYNNEQSIAGTAPSDVIAVADIAALMHLNEFANVENAAPTDGDFLMYNDAAEKWQGHQPATGTLVTAIGYDADGQLKFQDVTALTQAPVDNTPRVLSQTSVATLTFDTSSYDNWNLTAQAANLTLASPGTGSDHAKIVIRIKDNGTPRTITWNSIFRAIGVTLPTTTIANKVLYIGARYNAQDNKWDVLAIGRE